MSAPQPTLKFTPYENPMQKPTETTPQVAATPEGKQKRGKALKNPNNVEPKVKSKSKTKTLETPAPSNKLFYGKALWGRGGYAGLQARSGSVDSSNKSDSSSRSTGSEHTAAKTSGEVLKVTKSILLFRVCNIIASENYLAGEEIVTC